jgi:hypothetical protein
MWKKFKQRVKKNALVSFLCVLITLGITSRAIINGKPVNPDAYPQVFAIQNQLSGFDGGGWNCSSILVAPRLLLTAAHCVDPSRVILGGGLNGSDLTRIRTSGVKAKLLRAGSHPNYRLPTPGTSITFMEFLRNAAYDVGYIVLKEPILLATYPMLKDLTNGEEISFQGRKAILFGYGPDDERFLVTPYNGYGVKRFGIKMISSIQQGSILFQGPDQAALPGDSGGPVLVPEDNKWVLGGILSQFRKIDGTYEILAASQLRAETLCWVEKSSGVDLPQVACP